jgi:hypothetical protein
MYIVRRLYTRLRGAVMQNASEPLIPLPLLRSHSDIISPLLLTLPLPFLLTSLRIHVRSRFLVKSVARARLRSLCTPSAVLSTLPGPCLSSRVPLHVRVPVSLFFFSILGPRSIWTATTLQVYLAEDDQHYERWVQYLTTKEVTKLMLDGQ